MKSIDTVAHKPFSHLHFHSQTPINAHYTILAGFLLQQHPKGAFLIFFLCDITNTLNLKN